MLFTDIEGSTTMARGLGDRWSEVLASHHDILRRAIHAHNGFIEGTEGDAFFATFATCGQALSAARDAQLELREHVWSGSELRVRMGVHTGALERTSTGTVGLAIHRAARIAAAAHGRQVVVSAAARVLAPEDCILEDLGEHRLKDFPQPERLSHLVVGGLARDAFPPLRTLPVRPTNLPAFESQLVGRAPEIDQIRSLLSGAAHLVTITGRGGTGKTRLALAAGVELLDEMPGGVWFVPLADVTDSGQCLAAIAERVGIIDDPGTSLLQAIGARLARASTLLILDNLEQLDGAAETIDRLLSLAPSACILATSQVPLQLTREHVLALGPLSPESGVQMFLEQAARRGTRAAADGSLAAVRELCERLDGLPLAIELAAARTLALTPEDLLARLSDSLALLSSRDRDRPARQRSLRATIEWSLNLLEPGDAELFAALSVFAGTFTLADAEAIADGDVLGGLEALIEFSFVRRVATQDHPGRFTIAQSLREFGRERLVETGRLGPVADAHARWVLARAEAGWDAFIDQAPDAGTLVRGLADDARLALDHVREHDPDSHLRLSSAFILATDEHSVATSLSAELSHAIAAASQPNSVLGRAYLAAGMVAQLRGQDETALAQLELARALALEHGPAAVAGLALTSLAIVKLSTDPASARPLAEQALQESQGTTVDRGYAVQVLALVDIAEGRVEIEPLLAEQLRHATNRYLLAGLRHLYADCALLRADGPAAVDRYAAALHAAVADRRDINTGDLEGLAMGFALAGRPQDALEVETIAQAFRIAWGGKGTARFWAELRARHLDPILSSATDPPDPATFADLAVALDRALSLARAAPAE
jgi:predicted ATPase